MSKFVLLYGQMKKKVIIFSIYAVAIIFAVAIFMIYDPIGMRSDSSFNANSASVDNTRNTNEAEAKIYAESITFTQSNVNLNVGCILNFRDTLKIYPTNANVGVTIKVSTTNSSGTYSLNDYEFKAFTTGEYKIVCMARSADSNYISERLTVNVVDEEFVSAKYFEYGTILEVGRVFPKLVEFDRYEFVFDDKITLDENQMTFNLTGLTHIDLTAWKGELKLKFNFDIPIQDKINVNSYGINVDGAENDILYLDSTKSSHMLTYSVETNGEKSSQECSVEVVSGDAQILYTYYPFVCIRSAKKGTSVLKFIYSTDAVIEYNLIIIFY